MKNAGLQQLAFVLALSGGVAACTGNIDDPTAPGARPNIPGNGNSGLGNNGTGTGTGTGTETPVDQGNNPPPPPPSAQVSCQGNSQETVGRRTLRRLTQLEFDATIRAVFGLEAAQWAGPMVPPDPASLDGFGNNVDRLTVGPDYARGALDTAKQVASLVSTESTLSKLLPCSTAGNAACASTFVSTFGPKLYRRPLTAAETTRYTALYDKVSKQGDFKSFVYWATLTMLQSPNVIYRSELGEPDGNRFKLTQYEIATSLAYTFTGGPPTAELMQMAATNRLSTADQIETAARGLVFDAAQKVKPAFRSILGRFSDEWLGLSILDNVKKDAIAFPDFNEQIQTALGQETQRFISNVIIEEKGTAATLLTAPYTFVDAKLAKFYGYGAGATDFAKVTRPDGWGVGLFAQGGLLSVEAHSETTSPTKRGYLIRTRFMCGAVPPPPAVVSPLPEPTGAETTRKRYEDVHVAEPSCKSCHRLMDLIGFGFEHLDAVGRYREKEGAFDIDATGELTNTTKGDIKFNGPTELAQAVADLPETSECVGSYIAAYALGVSQSNVACLVRSAKDALVGGGSLLDYYIRISRSEHFRSRLP
jgi:hypothetical protein